MLMKDRKKDRKVEGIFHFLAIVRTGGSHMRERERRYSDGVWKFVPPFRNQTKANWTERALSQSQSDKFSKDSQDFVNYLPFY